MSPKVLTESKSNSFKSATETGVLPSLWEQGAGCGHHEDQTVKTREQNEQKLSCFPTMKHSAEH